MSADDWGIAFGTAAFGLLVACATLPGPVLRVLWWVIKAVLVLVLIGAIYLIGGAVVGSIGTVPALLILGIWIFQDEQRKTREAIRESRR